MIMNGLMSIKCTLCGKEVSADRALYRLNGIFCSVYCSEHCKKTAITYRPPVVKQVTETAVEAEKPKENTTVNTQEAPIEGRSEVNAVEKKTEAQEAKVNLKETEQPTGKKKSTRKKKTISEK